MALCTKSVRVYSKDPWTSRLLSPLSCSWVWKAWLWRGIATAPRDWSTCLLPHLVLAFGGVFIMLLGTVPILIADSGYERYWLHRFVEKLNVLLGMGIVLTVSLITVAALNWLALLAFIPLLVSVMAGVFVILNDDGSGYLPLFVLEQVKPASMELTKVTFTGFLAVSVPSFGSKSLSSYSHAFILLTAAAVITGIFWRLLTHITPSTIGMHKAVKRTVNVASVGAHVCIAAAVIPFTVMAFHALK